MPPLDVPAVGPYALLPAAGRPTPYGELRAATRAADGVPVALELLRPALAADPGVRARLAAGGDALRGLTGRHVVRVLHVLVGDDPAGPTAVVRDRFPAAVLADARRLEGGTLPPARAVATAVEVLSGLVEVHAAGLVHGALSEREVLLDVSVPLRSVVRVTGYGVAALLGRPVDVPLAPGAGPAPQPADDVWAAGALLALLLTGGGPEALQAAGPLPAPLLAALLPLLDADPARRPTAEQARDALADVLTAGKGLAALPALAPVAPAGPVPPPGGLVAPVAAAAAPVAAPPLPPPVPAPAPEPAAPVVLEPVPAAAPGRPGRRRLAVVATVVVLALLALVGGLVAGRAGGPDPAPQALAPARQAEPVPPHVFAPVVRPDGLVVSRTWTVDGDGTSLRGETVVSNDTGRAVSAGVDEVVPKSVAADVDDLVFVPDHSAVVERDPVVRFNVAALAPGATRGWRFDAVLTTPVTTAAALQALADDAERARAAYDRRRGSRPAVRLLRLAVSPQTLTLRVGQVARFTVTGRLSDGRVAPGAAIRGIAVRASDPRVLQTMGGVVRGRAPGRVTVLAEAGAVRASASVVVVAPPPAPVAVPTPTPSRAAPAPVRTTAAPRPTPLRTTAPPRPRPAPAAPRPTTARPRPATTAPRPAPTTARPATASPRPTATRSATPRPAATTPRPRPTF